MARISLGICLILVVASSVIYEAQGHFLLKHYLRKSFPRKCNEFTPYANKGMMMLVTDLESGSPATAEFKNFFTNFKSYMTFIESASATSKNVDVEITTKAEGLFKSMSAMSGGKGEKSADAGGLKVAMISMGKTLVEQKKNAAIMTISQKKRLIVAMVKWTRMIATFVQTASEKKGKSINIASYGLDVDVNDKNLVSTSSSTKSESSSSTKTEASSKTEASTSTKRKEAASGNADTSAKKKEAASGTSDTSSKTKEAAASGTSDTSTKRKEASGSGNTSSKTKEASGSGNTSTKTKEASGSGNTSSKTKEGSATKTESAKGAKESKKGASGTTFSDTTGAKSITPSGSPTASPSASTSSSGKTNAKGSAGVGESASSQTKESKSGGQASSSTSVKQVETETSKDAMTFIMELEKKYSAKAEFKAFFEKLKASMTAFSTISSKTAKDYVSVSKSASSKLSEAMALVGSRNVKSAKMKSNMEDCEQQLMKTLQELIDINSKIVNSKTVTSTQQTEIKQKITKWEKVTTQFVETAASSSSSSSSSSTSSKSEQSSGPHVKKD